MTNADPRITCMTCAVNQAMTCTNAVRAGISHRSRDIRIGRDFATLLQHCPAYVPKTQPRTNHADPRRSPAW